MDFGCEKNRKTTAKMNPRGTRIFWVNIDPLTGSMFEVSFFNSLDSIAGPHSISVINF
jgi:hypothetical protein